MKTGGSYASLLRGVSQQPPEVRQPGQHAEQINMLSHPVTGLARRPGSQWWASKNLGIIPEETALSQFATSQGYRPLNLTVAGVEYLVLMRSQGNPLSVALSLPPAICFNKVTRQFLDVQYTGVGDDASATSLNTNGISAATPLGRFIVFAQNNRPITVPTTPAFPAEVLLSAVCWVRGGAYDRTYRIEWNGGLNAVFYTTPAATVAGSATAISPQNIAAQLAALLVGVGVGVLVQGSHIYIALNQPISVSDGGDGTLIRGLYQDVEDISKLTLMGFTNQVVRVGHTASQPGFYVKAVPKGGGNFGEVIWQEAAGDHRPGSEILNVGIATVHAGVFYVGMYNAFLPGGGLNIVGVPDVPNFQGSSAGDENSNPTPRWMRGQINYLGTFQDRLLVGCGAALSVSAAGDYFNFFRTTVATVLLSDPFEMIPQGGEDDVLRHSVAYNRNLVIFGEKQQYIISGSTALTPTSPNMSIMTVYAGAATVPPIAAGGQIYYARNRDRAVALHQIQPGTYVDSAESFPASAQIGTYIPANATSIEAVPGAPAQLLVRSGVRPRDVFVFSYLDEPDGRKQDAWGRWSYDPLCGFLLGVQNIPEGVLLIWARYANGKMWLVADLQSVNPELSDMPYLDSVRPHSIVLGAATDVIPDQAGWSIAFDDNSDRFLIGGDLDEAPDLIGEYPTESSHLQVGVNYESSVTLTNPFIRDGQGKAILTGRTVVATLVLALKKTAGLLATIVSANTTTEYSFNGRVLGDSINTVGTVPVADAQHTVAIGREVREYVAKLAAKLWYPLTITGIEWVGQSFNRTPRANS